jgi:hypothetical protein
MPENQYEDLEPLDIHCTSSDCENGLHCFRQTRKMAKANISGSGGLNGLGGQCRSCGATLVDWSRVYKRDLSDVAYTFTALKYELMRHHFWHVEIDQKAINHARRKGMVGMRIAAEKRLRDSVASEHPFHDGWQTPKSGNAIYYAQHATASCCRTCIEEWHGIPSGRELTEAEIAYLTELVMFYIADRLPSLTRDGEKVPRLSY